MRPLWSHKLKHDLSGDNLVPISLPGSVLMSPCRRSRRWFVVRGILYKGTLARNRRCSGRRRIDEADISTLVTVDQRVANCLEEAVQPFTAMRSRCRSSRADVTLRHPLPVFQVVRCLSVHCFQTRITVEMFHNTRAPIG
ncbi:uncharacterized protein TNCV_4829631 [Trichonephila clavipes]|nr:uncharacterized protein TNCV_4829631 [Trichonephila clavipes]